MGRPRQIMTSKKKSTLNRHLSSICGLSTASSKKEITPLDLIFHSSKKSSKGLHHYSHHNSFSKKINGINNIDSLLSTVKEYEKKKSFSNENKLHKNRIALGEISDFNNRKNAQETEHEKEKKINKSSKPYFRRIYSNEFMEFENERTKNIQYVKKYKEDDITFTKSKILPEIQWQDLDNDVDTSDEQKKSAIRKEVNWLGEAIKQIQNNEKFFKHNVTMYKLSQKFPSKS